MSDTNLVINLRELKEHPEKLTEFLKSFDIETVFRALKEVIRDYVSADMDNRSIFCTFETNDALMGMIGGRKNNIVSALMTVAKDHPEILDIVSALQELVDAMNEDTKKDKIVIQTNTKHLS